MAKEEKGFLDGLVEDFCRDLEIKGAIEASRDENGKVDKWKATGIAMGLGHTSDDDIVMMGAMLGAEGAFDDDDNSVDDDFDDIPVPIDTPTFKPSTSNYMTKEEYEQKKHEITSNANTNIGIIAIAAVGVFIGLFTKAGDGSAAVGIVCFGALAILGWAMYYFSNQKETDLLQLETEYTESKKKQEQEETSIKTYEALKNYSGSNDLCEVVNQVFKKAKYLFDEADKTCNIEEPSYDKGIISLLLTCIFHFTIKNCRISPKQKSDTFDSAISWCAIQTDFTGDMLYLEHVCEADESMEKALSEIYTLVTVAAHKGGNTDSCMDFTKTLCSLILLLEEKFDKQFSPRGFGESGVQLVLDTAKQSVERVIEEKLFV